MWYKRFVQTFQRNLLPLSSGLWTVVQLDAKMRVRRKHANYRGMLKGFFPFRTIGYDSFTITLIGKNS